MPSGSRTESALRRPDAVRLRSLDRSFEVLLATGLCAGAIALGWSRRDALGLIPAEGAGYALGVIGLSAMALLLLYSLRKRLPALRAAGPLRGWFRVHMVLGILGPTAILFHADFHARSLNARVALYAMLTVAASGYFGRFIYTRVHRGLYGRRETLRELTEQASESRALLEDSLRGFAEAQGIVRAFEQRALRPERGVVARVLALFTLGVRARLALRRARARLGASAAGDQRWRPEAEGLLRAHLRAVRRAATFELWEKIFSAWHVLHFPLTAALFLAATIHVLAVNLY